MKRHALTVLMTLLAAGISGAIFLVALFHEFALVEVAAALLTSLQVLFLAAAIADMLERKKQPSHVRNSAVLLATIFLIAYYSFTRYLH